ncbi:hypothetical protein [Methylobacterium sp. NFXW15]|uniref:hypothetical protein n=1 Tax=Methylobacterium sp. NFXW15 TaxID=2819512 RepID=UPI003CEFC49A
MGCVHRLPVVLQGEAGRRLGGELAALLGAGGAPGSRRHQIEVLRRSITEALRALSDALAAMLSDLPADDPTRSTVEDAVLRFMSDVEVLVAMVEPGRESEH